MSAPSQQPPSLTWGVLSLIPPEDIDDIEPDDVDETELPDARFDIEAIDGTNRGNPVPIVETLPSLLIEGALAMRTGWENRQIPIRLRISANDGDALSEAEAALMQQVLMDQPPPLAWTSPVGGSATSVYDVVVANLEEDTDEGWDLDEILYGERFYTLTLTCLPFARAMESVTVPALPVPVDPDTAAWEDIDVSDSVTGWTAEATHLDLPPEVRTEGSEDFIVAEATFYNAGQYLRMVRTGAVDMGGLPYLAVDADFSTDTSRPRTGHWTVKFDGGSWITPISVVRMTLPTGVTIDRAYYNAPDTFTTLTIAFDITTLVTAPSSYGLGVVNVAATDTIGSGSVTTSRQQSRLVTVLGSAPTQAACRLYDDTPAPLGGDILIYTTRNTEFRPNLRQWVDPDAVLSPVADTGLVSGAHHNLGTPTPFLVAADLLYAGTYALLARVDVSAPGTLTWEARIATTGGATTIVGGSVVVSGSVDLDVTDGYQIVDIAAMVLPPVEVDGVGRTVKLTLTGTADMEFDEGWLFSLDDGVLTWIRDDEDLAWVDIRSPELGAARPAVWGGRNALGTGAACVDWKCLSFGPHRFDPGVMQIFTICTTSLKSQCELEYFARYLGNVRGEEAA